MDPTPIRIKVDEKAQPNLRKLARALISLARRELAEQKEQAATRESNPADEARS